jgi:signal transduction histidine kinase
MREHIPAWLSNLGLQRRIQLLIVIGLAAVLISAWAAGMQAIRQSTQRDLDHQLTIAGVVAAALDRRLDSALRLMEDTASQLVARQVRPTPLADLARPDHAAAAHLLRDRQLQLSTYGHRLFWLDPAGLLLWAEPTDTGMSSTAFSDLLANHLNLSQNAYYVSNLEQPDGLSTPWVWLVMPVRQPLPGGEGRGAVESLLVEQIGLEQLSLSALVGQLNPTDTVQIAVVDHAGVVLTADWPQSQLQPSQPTGMPAGGTDQIAQLIDNRQPAVRECHECHASANEAPRVSDEIMAFVPLKMAPWGVVVRQPAQAVAAPATYFWQRLLLGGGSALGVALLVTWWLVSRNIVKPIQALDEASAQMASGRLDVPIRNGGIDEVARLTANLERMRVKLESTLDDHRRGKQALQQVVEEHTAELTVLYEQLEGRKEMCKRLLGRVLTAQEAERARLARELHDSIGQSITAVIMTTTAVENSLPGALSGEKDKLANVRAMATQALHDLRGLIFDLRPEILDDLGLALALRSQVKTYLEPAGVRVQLHAAGLKDQLPPEVETTIFRVVQEAITNIGRHAHATEASIVLTKRDNKLMVRVQDNGVGFDLALVDNGNHQAWGLRGMEERVTMLGGQLFISTKPGGGTVLQAEVPLDQG